jgi:lipoyl-dependent peroxiredoxin
LGYANRVVELAERVLAPVPLPAERAASPPGSSTANAEQKGESNAIAQRAAEVDWEGPLARGTGVPTSGSGALDRLAVTWASRTSGRTARRARRSSSPRPMPAASRWRSRSCSARNKTPPERLTVSAACTLDEVDGAPRITIVQLNVRARVPGLEAAELEHTVGLAADLCPVSNALRGNVEISVRSELEEH